MPVFEEARAEGGIGDGVGVGRLFVVSMSTEKK
jgi:hypothetical protein